MNRSPDWVTPITIKLSKLSKTFNCHRVMKTRESLISFTEDILH